MASKDYGSWANSEADRVGISGAGRHNGVRDAARHGISSASVSFSWGSVVSRALGDANEAVNTNPADESYMDSYNNAIGRAIGGKVSSEDDIVLVIVENLQAQSIPSLEFRGHLTN